MNVCQALLDYAEQWQFVIAWQAFQIRRSPQGIVAGAGLLQIFRARRRVAVQRSMIKPIDLLPSLRRHFFSPAGQFSITLIGAPDDCSGALLTRKRCPSAVTSYGYCPAPVTVLSASRYYPIGGSEPRKQRFL